MNLSERAAAYNTAFPKYPSLFYSKNFILGTWMIGNYYRNKTDYHGAYPHSYLKRILSMFPDVAEDDILQLFSGSLGREDPGIRFDINPDLKPDIVGEAMNLSSYFPEKKFNLILADPPYSEEDANKYGIPMVNRNRVVKECVKVLKPGGFLVWLDQVFPMYSKQELKLVGTIGVVRSTNHRTRMVFIWERV